MQFIERGEHTIMKRLLTILVILLLPLSVWAMTQVNDSDLSNVTGQAGVNINADITMNISIGTKAWGDSDGITGVYMPWSTVSTGGYIGITGFNITNLWIRARTDTSDVYNSYSTLFLKPITIDVATDSTTGHGVAGTTFVRIGLGALQISMDALQFEIALGSHAATNYIGATPSLKQGLGVVSLGGIGIWINPWSYIDIYNGRVNNTTTAQGVTLGFNVIIDHFTMDYLSWGDPDGLPGGKGSNNRAVAGFKWISSGNTAGYVGLNNFTIGDNSHAAITVTGAVAIDVATSSSGTYSNLYSLLTSLRPASQYFNNHNESNFVWWINRLNAAHRNLNNGDEVVTYIDTYISIMYGVELGLHYTQLPLTVVHLSFPTDFDVIVDKIWEDVQLSSSYNLGGAVAGGGAAAGVGELGDMYLSGCHLNIKKGGWVDIWSN
jgi:hypothetical protein